MTKVTINGTFYAKVTNETTGEERVATMSITNIDSNKPVIEKLETSIKNNGYSADITVTVTAKDNETGIPSTQAYKWYLDDEPTPKATTDENYYTFTGVPKEKGMTHTFKVEVTDNVGNTQERSTEPVDFNLKMNDIIKPENYGDKIEYSANGVNDWKIFYVDDNDIFIIATNEVNIATIDSSTGITKGTQNNYAILPRSYSTAWKDLVTKYQDSCFFKYINNNVKNISTSRQNVSAMSSLLDIDKWSKFVNIDYADEAVGAAPVELFVKSWNEKHSNEIIDLTTDQDYYTSTKECKTLSVSDDLYFHTHNQPNLQWLAGNHQDSTSMWSSNCGYPSFYRLPLEEADTRIVPSSSYN